MAFFSIKYFGFQYGDEIPYRGVFKSDNYRPCMKCGRWTCWVDMNFEANICSEECQDEINEEFWEACKERNIE